MPQGEPEGVDDVDAVQKHQERLPGGCSHRCCPGADHAGRTGRYLTDGVNLYRSLGILAGAMGQMVGLENCRSLDVMLLPIGELRSRGLRAVIPAG